MMGPDPHSSAFLRSIDKDSVRTDYIAGKHVVTPVQVAVSSFELMFESVSP